MSNKFSACGPAVAEADLQEVAARIGVALPQDLREHYLKCNGGRPQKSIFLDADENDFGVNSFRRMKHKAPGEPLIEETYENLVIKKKIIPSRLLPFAANSGGDLYCMDLRDQSIWFWAADDYEAGDLEKAATKIAASLRAFIEGMVSAKKAYG